MADKFEHKFEGFGKPSTGMSGVLGSVAVMSVMLALVASVFAWFVYRSFRVEVPAKHVAVLTHKVGDDLASDTEIATDPGQKGVQLEVLREGRYFYNPYNWSWTIIRQAEVPEGKVGVLIRLFGDDLPHHQLLATTDKQKGIVPDVLGPGRYPAYSNPYAYRIELCDTVTIPAGFKGVETLLTGTPSKNPNRLLVDPGERGVQKVARDPGTYYLNPYVTRISQVDCRTKRLDLADELDMGFPSRDGFWIRLDGTVQFHVDPERAAEIFVTYNLDSNGDDVYDELVDAVILPNARSFCRLAGSSYSGRQFIEGTEREEFQRAFQAKLIAECEPLGVKIDSALITKIYPPEPIAKPVRMREIAKQQQNQFKQEMLQQQSEAKLIIEKKKIEQRTRLVEAQREVIQIETKARQEQQVAVTLAEQELAVAKTQLEAAKDQAEALTARGRAEAQVIRFNNEANVSGLKAGVEAFGGNGFLFAQNALFTKLAPAFRQIMANTSDSPIMRVFDQFQASGAATRSGGNSVPHPTPGPLAPANSTETNPALAGQLNDEDHGAPIGSGDASDAKPSNPNGDNP